MLVAVGPELNWLASVGGVKVFVTTGTGVLVGIGSDVGGTEVGGTGVGGTGVGGTGVGGMGVGVSVGALKQVPVTPSDTLAKTIVL